MERSFERELPEGYRQVKHIDAKNLKLGIIFNLIGSLIAIAVILLGCIPFFVSGTDISPFLFGALVLGLIAMFVYMVLHELVHGAAYKKLTGEKLTFGLSWSCAFCGVPKIYTYRRTALIAVLAPFVVFSLLFAILTVALYFVSPVLYLASVTLLGLHLGGCVGDLYVTILLLFKFKDKGTLMRDTGPEQFFYVPE